MTPHWDVRITVKTFRCYSDDSMLRLVTRYRKDAVGIDAEWVNE